MSEYIVWECFTVRNGFRVEAKNEEEALKKIKSGSGRNYSHYKTEDWKLSHREVELLKDKK